MRLNLAALLGLGALAAIGDIANDHVLMVASACALLIVIAIMGLFEDRVK